MNIVRAGTSMSNTVRDHDHAPCHEVQIQIFHYRHLCTDIILAFASIVLYQAAASVASRADRKEGGMLPKEEVAGGVAVSLIIGAASSSC